MSTFRISGLAAIAASAALVLSGWQELAYAESLDSRFTEVKSLGSLKEFCIANPRVDECLLGIGNWKPVELERIKQQSIQCYDTCPLDTYGFVRSSDGTKEYPTILTKDFDGGSASRGVEFRIFPLAIEVLKYEGCVGCPLIKTSPRSVRLLSGGASIQLPLMGYGVFYLPRAARSVALTSASMNLGMEIIVTVNNRIENRRISPTAVKEYARMLSDLNYDQLR